MLYNITNITKNLVDIQNDPLSYLLEPYLNLFKNLFGSGEIFYFIPILSLSLVLYYKTDEPILVSVFLILTGSLLGISGADYGYTVFNVICVLIISIGITMIIVNFLLKRRE